MTLEQLRAEMAYNSDLEKLDMAEGLLREQIKKAAECGLPVDLTLLAMFGLALERLQEQHGPEELGNFLSAMGVALVCAAGDVGHA